MNESFLLTYEVIETAVNNAFIMMGETAKHTPLFNDCKHFYIVVMDPTRLYDPNHCFEDAIIYKRIFNGGRKYKGYAHSKAMTARRCRMTTSLIIKDHPYLLKKGDTVFPGGVYDNGLVVAVSGTNPEFDELFACTIIGQCRAIIRLQMNTIQGSVIEYLGKDQIVLTVYDEHHTRLKDCNDKLRCVAASLGCGLEAMSISQIVGTEAKGIEPYKRRVDELITQNTLNIALVMFTHHMFSNARDIILLIDHIIRKYKENRAFLLVPVLYGDDKLSNVIPTKIISNYRTLEYLFELPPLNLEQDSWERKFYDLLQSRLEKPITSG